MLNALDFIIIFLYFLILLLFGVFVRRVKDFEDYSLGKRLVPYSMIFASLSATYIGPGYAVGFVGKGYKFGYLFYILPLFFVFQTLIVGKWIAPKLNDFQQCHTVGDIIGEKYGKFSHFLTGLISVGLCIGFSAVMAKVGGVILAQTTGWNLIISISIVTGVGILYTYTGGLKSVIATESFQFAIFTIVLPLIVFLCISNSSFDFTKASHKASLITVQAFNEMGWLQIFGIAISFFLGETLIPPYTNRALAGKNGTESSKGFLLSGLFGIIWIGLVIGLGVIASTLLKNGIPEDEVFMQLIMSYIPHGLIGVVMIALVAIVMSSQESVLNAGAVSFTRDIVKLFKNIDDKQSLFLSKAFTLICGILATFFAIYSPSIIDGLLILYSIWAPTVLIPLVVGLFIKDTTNISGWLAIIVGGSSSLAWRFTNMESFGIPSILVGLFLASVAYFLSHTIAKKTIL